MLPKKFILIICFFYSFSVYSNPNINGLEHIWTTNLYLTKIKFLNDSEIIYTRHINENDYLSTVSIYKYNLKDKRERLVFNPELQLELKNGKNFSIFYMHILYNTILFDIDFSFNRNFENKEVRIIYLYEIDKKTFKIFKYNEVPEERYKRSAFLSYLFNQSSMFREKFISLNKNNNTISIYNYNNDHTEVYTFEKSADLLNEIKIDINLCYGRSEKEIITQHSDKKDNFIIEYWNLTKDNRVKKVKKVQLPNNGNYFHPAHMDLSRDGKWIMFADELCGVYVYNIEKESINSLLLSSAPHKPTIVGWDWTIDSKRILISFCNDKFDNLYFLDLEKFIKVYPKGIKLDSLIEWSSLSKN